MKLAVVRLLCLVPLLTLVGCGERVAELTAQDQALAAAAGIPEDLVRQLLGAGKHLQRLKGINDNEEPMPLPGVMAEVSHSQQDDVIKRLRAAAPAGYFVFVAGKEVRWMGYSDQIAIVRGMGPYDVMRAMGTDGANYGISTEMVIERLRRWDSMYGLNFIDIDRDAVSFEFRRKPSDMMVFAGEVFAFCPDSVKQGAGSVDKLASLMARENGVYLWWD